MMIQPEHIWLVTCRGEEDFDLVPVRAESRAAAEGAVREELGAAPMSSTTLAELRQLEQWLTEFAAADGERHPPDTVWLLSALTAQRETVYAPVVAPSREAALMEAAADPPGLIAGAVSLNDVRGMVSFLEGYEREMRGAVNA